MSKKNLKYLSGFGNEHTSECLEGAVPKGQNNPQKCAYGLVAEQLSGTAFTAPKCENQRSWLYRIYPSVKHTYPFKKYTKNTLIKASFTTDEFTTPQQLRWMPFTLSDTKQSIDFVDGLITICGAGSAFSRTGFATHIYLINQSMKDRALVNADGDFLFVPQQGELTIKTEFGILEVKPGEICVIQRGIKFQVNVSNTELHRGYVAEIFDGHFELPERGPIGANGLANSRDFLTPVAAYEDIDYPNNDFTLFHKYQGGLFTVQLDHSPFDVVGWFGNYAPYKYDLANFCTMNSVSFDHPDPSIYTVLTCQSAKKGTAILDFVIFPPRWTVMEHSFRPPYFHRNIMSEFMGLIKGSYDAKEESGFFPGGASLHNCMSPHGPEYGVFKKFSEIELKPEKYTGGLAFMFESMYMMNPTEWASKNFVDKKYNECWQPYKKQFNPKQK